MSNAAIDRSMYILSLIDYLHSGYSKTDKHLHFIPLKEGNYDVEHKVQYNEDFYSYKVEEAKAYEVIYDNKDEHRWGLRLEIGTGYKSNYALKFFNSN